MGVHASKKEKTKVIFLNVGQDLVKDINNYIKSQKDYQYDPVLHTFLILVTNGYMYATKANNIKIQSLDTYCRRTEYFIESQDCFRSIADYLEVVLASHDIAEKRFITWSVQTEQIVNQIGSIRTYDLGVARKVLGETAFSRKEIQDIVDRYKSNQYKDRLQYRREIALKSIDELLELQYTEKDIDKLLNENMRDYTFLSQQKKKFKKLEDKK